MLFDSGAIHSFISVMLVNCLDRHMKCKKGQPFRTVLPSDDIKLLSYWLRAAPVVIIRKGIMYGFSHVRCD